MNIDYGTVRVCLVTLYKVTTNTDLTEGRGLERVFGWYATRDVAEEAARGNYVMGTNCPIEEVRAEVVVYQDGRMRLRLLGDGVDTRYESPAKVRDRALAKLTSEERAALGLERSTIHPSAMGKGMGR